ncbi:MAG: UDP-glucuronosyltransferase [Pseudomonadota bacterium]
MKILFAWEIGGNLGHIAKYLPLLRLLRQRGHELLFASKEIELAQHLLAPEGIAHVQAPLVTRFTGRIREPASFADILAEIGFADTNALAGLLSGWRNLFELFKPDVLVAEYAPAAQFAARLYGVPCLGLSTGFEHPPNVQPFPLFRPWLKLSTEALLKKEAKLLGVVNTVLTRQGIAPMARLQDVLKTDLSLLTTLPELDHYGARKGASYIGPMFTLADGLTQDWAGLPGSRIFAYLRPYPELPYMLDALSDSNASVLAVVPGIGIERAATYSNERLHVFSEQLKLAPLLPDMDLAITHSGHGLAGAFLLNGVPMLTVPTNIEQYMMSGRLIQLGVGKQVTRDRVKFDFTSSITQIVEASSCREQARVISKKYAGYDADRMVLRVANTIERLPRQGAGQLSGSTTRANPMTLDVHS